MANASAKMTTIKLFVKALGLSVTKLFLNYSKKLNRY